MGLVLSVKYLWLCIVHTFLFPDRMVSNMLIAVYIQTSAKRRVSDPETLQPNNSDHPSKRKSLCIQRAHQFCLLFVRTLCTQKKPIAILKLRTQPDSERLKWNIWLPAWIVRVLILAFFPTPSRNIQYDSYCCIIVPTGQRCEFVPTSFANCCEGHLSDSRIWKHRLYLLFPLPFSIFLSIWNWLSFDMKHGTNCVRQAITSQVKSHWLFHTQTLACAHIPTNISADRYFIVYVYVSLSVSMFVCKCAFGFVCGWILPVVHFKSGYINFKRRVYVEKPRQIKASRKRPGRQLD